MRIPNLLAIAMMGMCVPLMAQKPGDVRLDRGSGDYFVTVMNDAGQLVEMLVVPPNKVQLNVNVHVGSVGSGRLRYDYLIEVRPGSQQPLAFFEVDCPLTAGIVNLHAGAPSPWATLHSQVSDLPSCVFDYQGTPLETGGTLAAGFEATFLPTVGESRAHGKALGFSWPTFDPIEANEPAVVVVNSLSGVSGGWKAMPTIVPGRDPSTVTDAGVGLGFLRGDVETSCGALAWITDSTVCTLLLVQVSDAQTAWSQADSATTRTVVEGFLNTVQAQHDTAAGLPITDNAFWLLTVNAEFILELLPLGSATDTLGLVADTYLRSGSPNRNQGDESILRIRASGNNRVLLQADSTAVAAAIGTGTLVNASLELTITFNADNWGPTGRTIDLHRLTQRWTELGATWNCGDDLDPSNRRPDCPDTAWEMRNVGPNPWVTPPTGTVLITNGLGGVISFDVTADLLGMLAGQLPMDGWILRRTSEGPSGRVEFGSRESASAPRLVLEVQP